MPTIWVTHRKKQRIWCIQDCLHCLNPRQFCDVFVVHQQVLHFMVFVKCIDACLYSLGLWYFEFGARMVSNWCVLYVCLIPIYLLMYGYDLSNSPRHMHFPETPWSSLATLCRIARASLHCSRIFVPGMLLIFYIEFPQTHPRPRNQMKQFGNILSHCAGQSLLFKK